MHGNVYEWCQDVYNDNYIDAPKDGSPWLTGKDNEIKLLRGGSWIDDAWDCRSAIAIGTHARVVSTMLVFAWWRWLWREYSPKSELISRNLSSVHQGVQT